MDHRYQFPGEKGCFIVPCSTLWHCISLKFFPRFHPQNSKNFSAQTAWYSEIYLAGVVSWPPRSPIKQVKWKRRVFMHISMCCPRALELPRPPLWTPPASIPGPRHLPGWDEAGWGAAGPKGPCTFLAFHYRQHLTTKAAKHSRLWRKAQTLWLASIDSPRGKGWTGGHTQSEPPWLWTLAQSWQLCAVT